MTTRWFYDFEPVFSEFSRIKNELDTLFETGKPLSNIRSVPRGTFPAINIAEHKDGLDLKVYVPGVDPKSIDLNFIDNAFSIKGERKTAGNGKTVEQERYHRRERFSGPFSRIIGLPEGLDSEKIDASCKDGVLHIFIQKKEEKKPKQISIKVD